MEFENNTADRPTGISDAERLSAATKRIELTPLHADVAPESMPNGAASDAPGGLFPQATIASESEDTSAYQNKITSVAGLPTRPHTKGTLLLAVIFFAVVTGSIVYILVR